jgi:FKBP-type peptidyl-prolyl cis-trans isomerase
MKAGGQRRLTIPPDLAYGSTGSTGGVVPPNSTIVFDVELLDVQG